MKHKDFAAFILTHGRANKVFTYKTLRRLGYTGRIVVIIDNEDQSHEEYREKFGDELYVFDKEKAAGYTDIGDNFPGRRGVVYARNACFDIAKDLGIRYFIMLDDDYTDFRHMADHQGNYVDKRLVDLDALMDVMMDYYISIPALTIAMAQSGDYVGGDQGSAWRKPKRKAMNSFFCSTDRPFKFFGRINEDVNSYVDNGVRGGIFLTVMKVCLKQKRTQSNSGGLTELYLDSGTYVKTFYSVIYQPSSVKISVLDGGSGPRIHHKVRWRNTVPVILTENFKKLS